jgi:ribosomal protein S30
MKNLGFLAKLGKVRPQFSRIRLKHDLESTYLCVIIAST